MRRTRPRRFALGISTPKRCTSNTPRSNFLQPLLVQPVPCSSTRSGAASNSSQKLGGFEESLQLPSSQLEQLAGLPSSGCLHDESFVSARSALEADLQNVNWASPIPTKISPSKRKLPNVDQRFEINTHVCEDFVCDVNEVRNEIKDLSDEMFESKLEVSCTKNHESTQFCKTTQYRKEVESLFEKVEMSICGFDKSIIQDADDLLTSETLFETKDSFLLDIKESNAATCIVNTKETKSSICKKNNEFYGLPPLAKSLFMSYKNVDKLYDWQKECLNLDAIRLRKNLIYALPTSGGKTLVAEILMLKEVICRKRNVLFILPFVALVQEKVWGLSPFAVQMDFLIEEYAAGKGNFPPKKRRKKNSIYIATLEKGLGLVRNLIELKRLNEIGLIVIGCLCRHSKRTAGVDRVVRFLIDQVDELHLLGEPSRGCTLEMMLASVMYTPNDIQIIGMSATIGNIDELAKFLNAEIYSNQFRPVELKEYVKVGDVVSLMTWMKDGSIDINVHRQVNYKYSPQVQKIDPDHLGGLVMEVIPKGSCLIFCPTKKNCENVAVLLCKVIFRNLLDHKAEEKRALLRALRREAGGACGVLAGAVPWGVAYHHSGLTAEERRLLEDSFRAGVLSVLCCTSTLAAGVNLPAARVILRSPYVGRDFITLGRYKQMAGRAGRAGFGSVGESIVICPQERYGQLCETLSQPMDKATSGLCFADGAALRGFVLSALALGMADDREKILGLLRVSLLGVQAERLGLCLKKLANDTLKGLIVSGAVEVFQPGADRSAEADGCNQKLVVYTNSTLKVSKLGKASIKGCMELSVAQQLYDDMRLAQRALVVMGVRHLLYLVTPYEYADIQPNMAAYYSIYSNLDSEGKQTAKVLGITESNAVRMVTGKSITNVPERVLARFYVSLMLHDLWSEVPVAEVADKYHVSRGKVQSMLASAASFACGVLRFCEQLDELWAFRDLLAGFTERLAHCCGPELLPLMALPSVKKGRAMQLYKSGYKRIEDIARANPADLVESIDHLSTKLAVQLISSAKMLLIEKVENLREEAEDVMDGLGVLSLQ